jgi:hypothetical protein
VTSSVPPVSASSFAPLVAIRVIRDPSLLSNPQSPIRNRMPLFPLEGSSWVFIIPAKPVLDLIGERESIFLAVKTFGHHAV